MAEKVQIVIEVDSAKGTAQVKGVGDSFVDLQKKAKNLADEYGRVFGAAGKTAEAKRKVSDGAREASGNIDRMATSSNALTGALKTAAAALGAWKLAKFAQETALLTARVDMLGVVMDTVGQNALYTNTEMDGYAEAVRKMGITTQESRQTVARFAQAQLDLGKASKLARVAQDAAVIGNTNSSESLKGLMHGITTLQPEILRTYGIIVTFEQEYARFAAAAGRTVDSLTAQEKQQIALNAVLEKGQGIAGAYEAAMGTVGKQITSMPRLIEEAKLQFGEMLQPATREIVKAFSAELENLSKWLEEAKKSGELEAWARSFAEGTKSAIEGAKALAGNIRDIIEAVRPFAGTAAEMLVMGLIAEKAFAAARGIAAFTATLQVAQTTQMGLNTAMKGFLPYLVFFAAYKGTEWLGEWADGTAKVRRETEELSRALEIQKARLSAAEKEAAEKGALQRQWQEQNDAEFAKRLREAVEAERAQLAATQKEREEAMKRQVEADKKALESWEKIKEAVGKSGLEKELALLEKERAAYERVVRDKVALEKWFQGEKEALLLREKSASIALYEELYKATAVEEYAQKALAATQAVLDAEEKKWADILKSDEDAHRIRIQREADYVKRLKGLIKDAVEATKDGYAKQIRAAEDYARTAESAAAAVQAEPMLQPGKSYGGGTYDVINNVVFVNNRSAAEQYAREIQQIAENTRRTADEAGRTAAAAEESARRDAEQAARERQQAFQGGYSRFQGYIQGRERQDWGIVDWTAEFARLGESFAASSDYQQSLTLLDQMLDALESIDSAEQRALQENSQLSESLAKQGQSIADWLSGLGTSNLAPVQSAEAYANRFADKLAAALADTAQTPAFLSEAQSYLQFAKTYGDAQSYLDSYNQVIGAVDLLGGQVQLLQDLSDLGIGTTADDLGLVITAFNSLGISTETLKKAADRANTSVGGVSGAIAYSRGLSFTDALRALQSSVGTATGEAGLAKLIGTLGLYLPRNVDRAVGARGLGKLGGWLTTNIPADITTMLGADGAGRLTDWLTAGIPDDILTLLGDGKGGKLREWLATNIPADITTLLGADGAGKLADWLTDKIPTAVDTATGATGLDLMLYALKTAFPEAAGTATTKSSDLSSALLDTGTPFTDVIKSLGNLSTNTQTQLIQVATYWDTLAQKMGLAMNAQTAAGIIGSMQPPQTIINNNELQKWTISSGYWYNVQNPTWKAAANPGAGWSYWAPGTYYERPPGMAKGGLTEGLTLAGELGPSYKEWIVPTYEPERSQFLDNAPPAFWGNLVIPGRTYSPDLPAPRYDLPRETPSRPAGIDAEAVGRALAAQIKPLLAALASRDAGSNAPVHIHLHIDGREVADVVADQMRQGNRRLVTETQRIARLTNGR